MANIYISGFGNTEYNGTYYYQGVVNGYPYYAKGSDFFAIYYAKLMPITMDGAYFLVHKVCINDYYSAPVFLYKYLKHSTDITDATPWISTAEPYTGEDETGTVDPMSSSSSSSSSNSSSSSSSNSSSSSSSNSSSSSSSNSSSSSSSYIREWSSSSSSSSSIDKDMYIGGSFTGHSAKWNGTILDSMDTLPEKAYAYIGFGGDLYAAGGLDDYLTSSTGYCYKWNGTSWVNTAAVGYQINGLCVFNNELYACGGTGWKDVTGTGYCVKWNGSSWVAVGANTALDGHAYTLTVFNNELYMCGDFIGHCAKLNLVANTWDTVGVTPLGSPGYIMCVFNSELYVGTYEIGCLKLVSNSWTAVGSLSGASTYTSMLIVFNNSLYICGYFWNGDSNNYYVKQFVGGVWSDIGTLPSEALTLCVYNGDLYAAGGADGSGYCVKLNGSTWDIIGVLDGAVTGTGIFS